MTQCLGIHQSTSYIVFNYKTIYPYLSQRRVSTRVLSNVPNVSKKLIPNKIQGLLVLVHRNESLVSSESSSISKWSHL